MISLFAAECLFSFRILLLFKCKGTSLKDLVAVILLVLSHLIHSSIPLIYGDRRKTRLRSLLSRGVSINEHYIGLVLLVPRALSVLLSVLDVLPG